MIKGGYKIKVMCWCGEPMMSDGKRKWCSTREDGSPHEKYKSSELQGRKTPLKVDNHMTYVLPRKS